jgi:hypothetical protein
MAQNHNQPRESAVASVYDLKPRFQSLLRPLVGALARRGAE